MKAKPKSIDINRILEKNFLVFSGIFLSGVFLYFLTAGKDLFHFQAEQFLFLFSAEYLEKFLMIPGGLLEYAGRFLMQFYAVPATGALIISMVLALSGYLAYRLIKKLSPGSVITVPLAMAVPLLLLIMQEDYYYFIEVNLGFICIIATMLLVTRLKAHYAVFILIPFLYYLTGAFALIFLASYIVYTISRFSGKRRIFNSVGAAVITLITWFLFKNFLFLVPASALLTSPLSSVDSGNRIYLIILAGFIVIVPALKLSSLFAKSNESVTRYAGTVATGMLFFFAAILLIKMQNPVISGIISIQKAAYDGRWDDIIRMNEKKPINNLVSQYFYNTALAEKGLLCEKIFATSQDFGTKSLVMPWGNEHLERGAYFFYTAGLVNEAHRWAYEEMVVSGMRPHNLKMLIKTSLIADNDQMAHKYVNILKQSLIYRKDARYYESMIANRENLLADPELGAITRIIPQKDFFIFTDSPEDNLPLLFESNLQNRRAFEYMMAWLLLEKDVETALSNLHLMKGLGYTKLPRYIEEAVMIYSNSQKIFPDMGGLTVSRETLVRFDQYFNLYRQARNNPVKLQETMYSKFGDTFWYYFHFKEIV